jgi:hypothetical protein
MDLGQATRELIARQTSLDEFTYRSLAARIQPCLRPALVATHGSRWVGDWPGLVHDSALVQLMGNHDWFARTGEDLANQLPAAVSVLVDAGMRHPSGCDPWRSRPPKPSVKSISVGDH